MGINNIQKITNYIFIDSHFQKADLSIVFGTRCQEAIDKIFEIYRKKLVSKILVSGGINKVTGENEAEIMSQQLMNLGVHPEDIILENKSANSLENVLFSKKIIEDKIGFKNIKRIIAVVKHYHSRRALMTLKKHFPRNVALVPITYEVYDFTKDNWFNSQNGKERVMSEWNKISKYLAKGDIEEI